MDLLLYMEQIGCGNAAINGAKCFGMLLNKEHICCGIVAVKGVKYVGVLLYWEQIGWGIAAPKEENVFEWCCKRSKFVVGLLLKGSKMCGSAAVQGTNWL